MTRASIAITAISATLGLATAAQADKIKFEYWYGLSGYLGTVVQETCDRFNASQDTYEIVCVGQDGYAQAVQNTIAAFRAGKHPTIVQSYDAGTADLMLSGEFYPVQQMMADFGIDIDWSNYFPGISNYYASSEGELYSMPFNSSTAVMYYNIDDLNAAGIDHPPATWEEFEADLRALKAANPDKCAYAYAPSTWVDLEQFSMAHNIPVATRNNGYDGLDAEYVYNTTLHAKHMQNLLDWYKEGLSEIRTTQGGLNARDSFAKGQCSFYFGSIAGHQTIHNTADDAMNWTVAMLPLYEGHERTNTVVGGASLWVLSRKSEDEYRGAAEYLKFLATPESEEFWSTKTGYIPVTKAGYDALVAKGFYDNAPYKGREVAIQSLTFTEPTELTRGLRLGGFIQARKEWTNEVQAAFAGQKTMQEALDTAVRRSNKVLRNFERTYQGKDY
ncbi:Glycerol-3-phosphate ABC transporter, periplasmic glycerol-3-phosphate-binding protein [Rhodovulum sp. P5]|uniref:extracellular solute-binding protein n=1 Tax=Rhodovulum sp. P5 TaxID=1564506 RepID=UPI0009C2DB84|nr:extracellular solute-binding protein [Rhodovulum sp. P5]ARE39020.1 Glycerol-3-phosphate ABC transporter, periplasmic glycerol-3-phosphate-binding protein [Rhodovulum sp. P5]